MPFLDVDAACEPLHIGRVAFGCDHLTERWTERQIFSFFDRFLDAGGNCLDTARVYCGGESERVIGRYLKQGGRRDRIMLSTKGCHPPVDDMPHARLSPADMAHDLDESLRALCTDRVDLYWLHRDDPARPAEEIIEALNRFVKAGKIRAPGCSNWTPARIEQANRYAAAHGLRGFAASQIQWSLAQPNAAQYGDYGVVLMDDEQRRWYAAHRMPVFAYAAQAKGYYAKLNAGEPLSEKTRRRFDSPRNAARLPRLRETARRHGVSVAAVSLGYLSCNPLPTVAVTSFHSERQFRQMLEAVTLKLSADEAAALE